MSGCCVAGVAEPCEQAASGRLRAPSAMQRVGERRPSPQRFDEVEELLEALGVAASGTRPRTDAGRRCRAASGAGRRACRRSDALPLIAVQSASIAAEQREQPRAGRPLAAHRTAIAGARRGRASGCARTRSSAGCRRAGRRCGSPAPAPRPLTNCVKNHARALDRVVVEHRRQQLVHPVAERRRPQRPLHRARLHLVGAAAAVHAREQAGSMPSASASHWPSRFSIGSAVGVNSGAFSAVVEALVGVVELRVAGPARRSCCASACPAAAVEAAAARGGGASSSSSAAVPSSSRRAELQPEHEQPVEAGRACSGVRSIASPMPAATARSKSTIHFSWSGTNRSPFSGWIAGRLGVRRRRVGADVERQRDEAADRLKRLLAAVEAEHDEALGEVAHLRRLRPRVLLRRRDRAGRRRTTSTTVTRSATVARPVGEVERPVVGDELGGARPRRRPPRARRGPPAARAASPVREPRRLPVGARPRRPPPRRAASGSG